MYFLGISAYYHDSAAALIKDGVIIAAAQEERFTRKRHDSRFPQHAIRYCLEEAGIDAVALTHVVFYEKPFLKFERLVETYLATVPKGFTSFCKAIPLWLREKLFQKTLLIREMQALAPNVDWAKKILFSEHHLSHAASAFYPSPFEEALVLTIDGVGEWTTASASIARGHHIEIIREMRFPHSLGLLYSAFTYFCGFRVNSGEYKLMGLAPYGEPVYRQRILDHLIDVKPDGSFRLNMRYFDYCSGLTMVSRDFCKLFGMKPRQPEEPITQMHMDLAASVQQVLEEVMLRLVRSLAQETGMKNLCLAGGVALNCVANGKLLRDAPFDRIWIQPAAGDAGGALGAALAGYHLYGRHLRQSGTDRMHGAYLGPAFTQQQIEKTLSDAGAVFETIENEEELLARTAKALEEGLAVGWFQGRMEFGPRALGNRSILADPRNPHMQRQLNLKVKYRESFRPFAPSVLAEACADWFELEVDSPYMLLVAKIQATHRMTSYENCARGFERLHHPRSCIPAVTHVDDSARIQTVHRATNPRYHALLEAFRARTNCPVLVNTSFNVRGEPIVCTPQDAFNCFMGCEIEVLVIGNCWLSKSQQNPALFKDYHSMLQSD